MTELFYFSILNPGASEEEAKEFMLMNKEKFLAKFKWDNTLLKLKWTVFILLLIVYFINLIIFICSQLLKPILKILRQHLGTISVFQVNL